MLAWQVGYRGVERAELWDLLHLCCPSIPTATGQNNLNLRIKRTTLRARLDAMVAETKRSVRRSCSLTVLLTLRRVLTWRFA